MIHTVYKKIGETPLQALELLRDRDGLGGVSMTYAGRLDPMADGLLVILSGDDVHQKDAFSGLPKTYEFQVLFGISTDTADVLGVVDNAMFCNPEVLLGSIQKQIPDFLGEHEWSYPNYSSKTVEGKPLFAYARDGEEVEAPTRTMVVNDLELIGSEILDRGDLLADIFTKIEKVEGDFRQEEIKEMWDAVDLNNEELLLARFRADVESGTYIRTLSEKLGESLGVPALAFSIKRTRVGEYTLEK
jgi:tRNA pseudouridine(55) synthase